MRLRAALGRAVVLLLLAGGSAQAAVIFDVTTALSPSDPVQFGRLSRNLIEQDWAGSEPFPGVFNPTTPYYYRTFLMDVGLTPNIQINFDSPSPNTFVSAYHTAYLPNSAAGPNYGFDINWLGDAGASGNNFGNPLFFQVLVPMNRHLVVVVNNTAPGGVGVGEHFRLNVEGFIDTEYTDLSVPEPATVVLGSLALAAAAVRRRAGRSRAG